MNTSSLPANSRRVWSFLSVGVAAAALMACSGGGVTTPKTPDDGGGGGGVTVTPTAYVLFASNYVAYASQTNGAFLHSLQNGDVYAGFGGKYAYGCYSASQGDMDRTQLYIVQAQANGDGNCTPGVPAPPAPTTAADFAYVAIKAPASNAPSASIPPVDISQATKLLIQMGNTAVPDASHGHANVFTVTLTNDTKGDGTASTADCAVDQTLATVGPGAPSALGVLNYVIPLSSFTCSKGSVATLQSSGVTVVAVKFTGDKNPNVAVGEFNTIAVGYVGFTK